jgi:hypothetical protein
MLDPTTRAAIDACIDQVHRMDQPVLAKHPDELEKYRRASTLERFQIIRSFLPKEDERPYERLVGAYKALQGGSPTD